MNSTVLKWVLGVMGLFLLVGLIFAGRHLWGGPDKQYREGYVYRDGQYVRTQRAHPHRRGDRDDDRDDDDRRRASGNVGFVDRFFRSFRKDDDD